MSASFFEKMKVLIKAIRIVKNWQMFVALYRQNIKDEYVILETRTGIKIKLRVNSTDNMAFTHVWLLREYDKPGFEIRNDDIIIDIGAHIGLFALFASQFCKKGRIYCFEPVKENFDLLKYNLDLNDIKNVIPVNSAVSTNTGTVTIYLNDDYSGHSMHLVGTKKIEANSISLKDVIDSNNITKCDFLKIDCEGEEYGIGESLPTECFDKINKMCIEYHFADTKPYLLDNLIKKLKNTYVIETRKILPDIGFLYAKK